MTETSGMIKVYSDVTMRMLRRAYPNLSPQHLSKAIEYSINKRYKEENAEIYNNYTKKAPVNISLLDLADYIMDREPVIVASGVMFKKHGTVPNPLLKMIENFMESRGILKDKMFQYEPGTEEYEHYNLLQLLAKLDANGLYGVLGLYNSLYYDIHVAKSITTTGRALVSTAGLQFEMFLANGVKFSSLNEVMTFIDNVCTEKRNYRDSDILDNNIEVEKCFVKLIMTCGFEWIPTDDDLWKIWEVLTKLPQEDINRLFYKNNLYAFMDNQVMKNAIIYILNKLDAPYLNPNKIPPEIKCETEEFCSMLMEYVYYHYFFIDNIDRMDNMIKNVIAISDTDSTIISVDAWYRYIVNIVKEDGIDLKIMHQSIDGASSIEDESQEPMDVSIDTQIDIDYDFFNDQVVEVKRSLDRQTIIPQDNLRYSVINILAFCLDSIINDYMERYTKASNCHNDTKKCLIIMKNEYLFKTALLTNMKKNYATLPEIREGHNIKNPEIDIKGLAIDKSGMNTRTRKELKKILYEEILNVDHIDQMRVVSKIAAFEDEIYKSLESGSKEFCKPISIGSYGKYDDPMKMQGIKASIVWNELKDDGVEPLDLTQKNSIDILKVDINQSNAKKIQESYPDKYSKIIKIIGDPDNLDDKGMDRFKHTISAIGLPKDAPIPEWASYFIDYNTIVKDNLLNFPLESIGVTKPGGVNINYSNILSF